MYPENAETDQALWLLIRQSNSREAFEQLYRRYMRVLYKVIDKFTEDATVTEDLLQEVFLDLWEKRQSIDIQHKIFPYLYSIARFKLFDYVRKRNLTTQHLQAWQQLMDEQVAEPEVFAHALQRERETTLAQQIELLPVQMKKVYVLYFEQDKSIAEVADDLQLSSNTIKNHLQKLRRRFRSITIKTAAILFSLHSCLEGSSDTVFATHSHLHASAPMLSKY